MKTLKTIFYCYLFLGLLIGFQYIGQVLGFSPWFVDIDILNQNSDVKSIYSQNTMTNHQADPTENIIYGEKLLALLQKGGNVIVFRHFQTGPKPKNKNMLQRYKTFADIPAEILSDCSWQRNLNELGRIRAKAVNSSIQKLSIPVDLGHIYASPYCRTKESAEIVGNSQAKTDRSILPPAPELNLGAKNHGELVKRFLNQIDSNPSKNIIIASHVSSILPLSETQEGDAVVMRKENDGYRVIALVKDYEWALASENPIHLGMTAVKTKKP